MSSPTTWRPNRKFVAGLLTALGLFAYDAVTSGVTRSDLATILPQVSVLAAFYLVPDPG